jgi:hypothetical protein
MARLFFEKSWPLSRLRDALLPVKPDAECPTSHAPVKFSRRAEPSLAPYSVCARTAVQEVFAVTVLPGRRYRDLINDDEKLLENSFVVPDAALADVSPALRAPSGNGRAPHGSS